MDAKRAVVALERAHAELQRKEFTPPTQETRAVPKKRLVIKRNVEDIDYTEERAGALTMPSGREPLLPQSLRSGTTLKPYQLMGIAWLQNLWESSPDECRGTVLADDMGLGKTLQLLTFMASCFEADGDLSPALVVAPVALLENWRNELERFFESGSMPLLLLYGDALRSLACRQA